MMRCCFRPLFTQDPSSQKGLSLVEIMVALVISLLLMSGVIQIFIGNKATYRLQEGLGRLQENARFALDHMTRDIRQAGYLGCTHNLDTINSLLINPPAAFSPDSGIQGWEATGTEPGSAYQLNATDAAPVSTSGNDSNWQGWQPPSGGNALDSTPQVIRGSDILRVWHSASRSARVTQLSSGNPATIRVADNTIESGDIALLSDCEAAEWVQVCHSDDELLTLGSGGDTCGVGNVANANFSTLAAHAELTSLVAGTYFVGKRDGDAQSPPSLYYAGLESTDHDGTTGQAQELVEGVDSMQILYGEDTNNDGLADRYRTADAVSDWRLVLAVKIALLMRTVNEVDTSRHGGSYDVNGTDIQLVVSDHRPRKIVTTTILLRNRSS